MLSLSTRSKALLFQIQKVASPQYCLISSQIMFWGVSLTFFLSWPSVSISSLRCQCNIFCIVLSDLQGSWYLKWKCERSPYLESNLGLGQTCPTFAPTSFWFCSTMLISGVGKRFQHAIQQLTRDLVFSPRLQPRLLLWIWTWYVIERPISAHAHTQHCWNNLFPRVKGTTTLGTRLKRERGTPLFNKIERTLKQMLKPTVCPSP